MLFPWKTILGLLIQHGPSVVSTVKEVMTKRADTKLEQNTSDRLHRLETTVEKLTLRNEKLELNVEKLQFQTQNLQKILQWLVFYAVVVSLVFLFWIILSFKNS